MRGDVHGKTPEGDPAGSPAAASPWLRRFSVLIYLVTLALSAAAFNYTLPAGSALPPVGWGFHGEEAVLAVAFSHAPQVSRVIRSAALDVSEKDYIKAVELIRIPPSRIIFGDMLPNLVTPLMVEIGLRLTYSIVIIAGLSFIGFGLQPPDPNWGLMLNENRIGLVANPWAVVAPAVLIALLTVGTNTFTDAVARVAIGVDRPAGEEKLLEGVPLEVEP